MKIFFGVLFVLLSGCSGSPQCEPKIAPIKAEAKPYDNTVRDDSDPPNGRSGMWVLIDARTGCHYLGWDGAYNRGAAITPRMDNNGKQVCK
jgi:hypothetical protein